MPPSRQYADDSSNGRLIMAKKITSRNTKSEILEAYNQLKEELRAAKSTPSQPKTSTPPKPARTEPAPTPTVPKGKPGIDQVLATLHSFRGGLVDLTNQLQFQLATEASTLQEMLEREKEQRGQIQQLHQIEFNDDILHTLIEQYSTKSGTFEEGLETERVAFDSELKAKRTEWDEERLLHEMESYEKEQTWKKGRDREAGEYKYDREHQRKLDREERELLLKSREHELDLYESNRRNGFARREDALTERENAYKELTAKVARFDDQLKEAVTKARNEGTGIAKHQARVKSELAAKEHEGKLRVFEHRISALDDIAAKQQAKLESLQKQLLETQRQAQTLAVKAIEGASNASSFEAVREIAIEQAKHPSKTK